jgi:type IV pilus assembly protein PilY1
MGYSYGNPILTKRNSDGRWVVLVTSGYNNTGGDSKGRLFVLDAFTGARLSEIITDNSVTDPNLSGIGKINNYVYNTLVDNTTQYVYGGDLSGALWRFDLDDEDSQRLGRTATTAGNQPITVRPEIGRIRDSAGTYYRVIYFGTGRYLGLSDISATAVSMSVAQAIYSVKDTGGDLGVLTDSGAKLVGQTLDTSASPATIPSPIAVDWSAKNGWYVTLAVGNLVNVDPRLQLGTLVTLVNEPNDDYCSVAGNSYLYALDYRSGIAVSTQNAKAVGFPVGASIGTGLTLIRLVPNKLVAIVTQADTSVISMPVPVAPSGTSDARRVGWREIF